MDDPEVKALMEVTRILNALTEEQRRNVLLYVAGRFGTVGGGALRTQGISVPAVKQPARNAHGFSTFGELLDAADPETESDRVLVAAYWRQVVEGAQEIESYPVNILLKETGHTVSNITRSFDTLIAQSPRLVLQLKKTGRSKQARKMYKITREGLRRVEAMLAGVAKGS